MIGWIDRQIFHDGQVDRQTDGLEYLRVCMYIYIYIYLYLYLQYIFIFIYIY